MITFEDDGKTLQQKLDFNSALHEQLLTYVRNRRMASEHAISDDKLESWQRVDNHWRLHQDLNEPVRKIDGTEDPTAYWPFEYGVVIPATYAGLMVRLTQELAQFTQRDPIWELRGVGPEDIQPALLMEAKLASDMRATRVVLVLWSLLQDAERYGMGILRDSWEEEQGIVVERPVLDYDRVAAIVGQRFAASARMRLPQLFEPRQTWGIIKEYCRWRTIDPRWFYMDPNYSVGENQRGKWNGHRELLSVEYMEQNRVELDGDYFNIDVAKDYIQRRRGKEKKRGAKSEAPPGDTYSFDELDPNPAEVDHMEIRIVPYRMGLSPSENEEIWWVETVEDTVIVRCHPAPNWHQKFGYSIAEVQPDPHCFTNPGYAEHVEGLQWFIDFMMNAKFQYDRKQINNALFYSPEIIDEDDLFADNVSGHIKMTPWALRQMLAGRLNMTHAFRQIEMPDTTSHFVESAMYLFEQMNRELGSSDPISGMPLETKRTYGEVSLVTQMASQRIGTAITLIDEQAIEPTVNRSISNIQQFTTKQTWVRTTGTLIDQLGIDPVLLRQYDLYGNFDYIKVGAMRPLDPGRTLEAWTSFFQLIMQVPGAAMLFNLPKLFGEMSRVMGIRNYDTFLNVPPNVPVNVVGDEQFAKGQASGQYAPQPQEGAA